MKKEIKFIIIGVCGFLFLALIVSSFKVVETGTRGVETRFGQIQGEPLLEGLHFFNPFTSKIILYSVQQMKWNDKTPVFTKDTQRVEIDFAIVYSAEAKFVHQLYQEVGTLPQLEEKIIRPVVLGSIKDAIGSVIADELIMKRDVVTKLALTEVQRNLNHKHVYVYDIQFTNLDFDDAYESAIEQKVVAIQKAQKAKNDSVRIEEEAKQTIMSAEAEAQAMKIKSEALAKNKGLVNFEIAKKWDGRLPRMMFGNSMPLLNLKDIDKE